MVTPYWPKATSSWLFYTFMLWQHVLVLPTRAICYHTCNCFDVYVGCKEQELSEIPDGIPQYTRELNLKGNAFKTIDTTKLVNLTNLERLWFEGNQLTSLGPASLRGLRGLVYLSLKENQISEIANTTFEETPKLENLYLGKNRLTDITGMFRSLTNLRELDLSFNQIAQIKEEYFTGLNSMTYLDLRGNLLGTVPFSLPPNLNKLQTLYLDDNNISELAANTFSKMKELTDLFLRQNAIRTLRGMTFTGLRSLIVLALDSNPIETIEPQAFKDLKNVGLLSLSNIRRTAENNDAVIDPDVFHDMPKLSELALEGSPAIAQKLLANKTLQKGLGQVELLLLENNGLETLPEDFRASFPHIGDLYLSKNPWRCDEDLLALRNWMQDSSHLFRDRRNVICASPENLKGKAVFTIDIDQFTRGTTTPQDNIEEESSHLLNETPHVTSQKPDEQTHEDFDNDYIPIPDVDDSNTDYFTDDSQTNLKGVVRQSFDSDPASSDISMNNILNITAVVSAVLLIIVIFTIAMLRYRQRKKKNVSRQVDLYCPFRYNK